MWSMGPGDRVCSELGGSVVAEPDLFLFWRGKTNSAGEKELDDISTEEGLSVTPPPCPTPTPSDVTLGLACYNRQGKEVF